MRRAILLTTTAFACGIAANASAQAFYDPLGLLQQGRVYAGVDGGYHFPETFRAISHPVTRPNGGLGWAFGANNDNWAAYGKVGYEHDSGVRLELEYGYLNGNLTSVHGSGIGPAAGLCTPGVARAFNGRCGPVDGDLVAQTLMFNAIYDFRQFIPPNRFRLRPFIGGGVGGAFVNTSVTGQLSNVPGGYVGLENVRFDDNKPAFAYQGIAGLTYELTPNIMIDLTGRYVAIDRVRAPSVTIGRPDTAAAALEPVYDVGTFKGDYRTTSVTLGVRFLLGGRSAPPPPAPPPPPPPPPPEPPPPPPPPPPAAPEAKEFVVYFPFDQSILTTDAQAVVQAAATYAQQGGSARVVVVGHTDTSGSAKYNVRLSERRAKTVADALVGLGVNQSALQVDWKGESDPAVQTGDGVKEPLNRRATIDINF